MTLLSSAPFRTRHRKTTRPGHIAPLLISAVIAIAAVSLVAYLLWPTWQRGLSNKPSQLPVSIGGTVFNVPAHAFRIKVQKHSGSQERVDLDFTYPSLEAPDAPTHVTAETVMNTPLAIDRIFLSIATPQDALTPDERLRTIYPPYFDPAQTEPLQDGLAMHAFRDGTPYAGEDLFVAQTPALVARCTRDGATPGMCLSERRVGGAELTFRFPRQWLANWREVTDAMERLTQLLHGPGD